MAITLLERQSDIGDNVSHPAVSITTAAGNLLVLLATALKPAAVPAGTCSLTLVSPAAGAVLLFNTDVAQTDGDDISVACWYWPTTATTYGIEVDPGDATRGFIHALEITNSSGDPLTVATNANRSQTVAANTVTYDSITLTEAGALVFTLGYIEDVSGIAVPSGYSELYNVSSLGWRNILGSKSYAASGATGDASDAVSSNAVYFSVHLGIGTTGQGALMLGELF